MVEDFEKNLRELEKIADALEKGEYTLDESIELFDKGMKLVKAESELLETARLKIEELSASEGTKADE